MTNPEEEIPLIPLEQEKSQVSLLINKLLSLSLSLSLFKIDLTAGYIALELTVNYNINFQ